MSAPTAGDRIAAAISLISVTAAVAYIVFIAAINWRGFGRLPH